MALSPRKRAGVEAILATSTLVAAAKQAKVTEQTVYNWLKDPEFKAALDSAYDDLFTQTCRRLKKLAGEAVERLASEMDDDDPNRDRIAAADKLLAHALRYADAVEMKQKVQELEQRISDLTKEPDGAHEKPG